MDKAKENLKRSILLTLSAMALLLCLIVFITPAVPTQAAKLTDKSAKKILKKVVKGVPCHYAFVDFDNDGIDEMVVLGFSEEFNEYDIKERSVTVYKVENKKAQVIFRDYVTSDRTRPYIEFTYIKILMEIHIFRFGKKC